MALSAGSAYVSVIPSLFGFKKQIQSEVSTMFKDGIKVPVQLDLQSSGVKAQASAAAKAMGQEVKFKASLDKKSLSDSIIGVAALSRAMKTLALPGAVVAATPYLMSLAGSAVQASGAIALLPAVGFAAAAGIGALTIGMQGFGDAMKNMDDPEKFAEAIAKLSPAARMAAVTIRDLGPAWRSVRLDIQERLFEGVGKRISALSDRYLPVLRTQLSGTAGAFNRAAQESTAFLLEPAAFADMSISLNNVRIATDNAAGAARPLTQAFVDLVAVGSTFLPRMGQGVTDLAVRFRDFIAEARKSGQIRVWIQQGIDALKQFWQLTKNVGAILGSVFKAANADGYSFLQTLIGITGSLRRTLETPAGAAGLRDFFANVRLVVGELAERLRMLWPSVKAGGSAFMALLAGAKPFADTIWSLVAVTLPPLFRFIESIAPVLGPAIVALGAATIATKLWNLALLANPIGATTLAIAGLVAVIIYAWNNISWFRDGVMTAFNAVKNLIVIQFLPAFQRFIPVIRPIVAFFLNVFAFVIMDAIRSVMGVIRGLILILTGLMNFITGIFTGNWSLAWTGIKQIFTGVLTAIWNFAKLMLLGKIMGVFQAGAVALRTLWQGLWNGIRYLTSAVGNAIVSWLRFAFIAPIRGAFTGGVNFVRGLWSGFWSGLRSTASVVGGTIRNIISGALGAIRNSFRTAVDAIRRIWAGLREAAAAPVRFIVNTVYNAGIRPAWNAVANIVNLPKLPWHRMATGGRIQGGIPGKDSVPIMAMEDEFVVRREIAKPTRNFLEALNSGQPEAVQAAGGFGARMPGMAAGGAVEAIRNAFRVGRSMDGRPYRWGGSGRSGTDCSGIIAYITRALRMERNPYRRIGTTASMPWGGFARGLRSAFGVGNVPGSHMRGTLAGTNVESGGSHRYVAFGPPAKGAPYGTNWHLPQAGGQFVGGGGGGGGGIFDAVGFVRSYFSSVLDKINSITDRFGNSTWVRGAAGLVKKAVDGGIDWLVDKAKSWFGFDTGGYLMPGFNIAYNGTGQRERVLDASDTRKFDTLTSMVNSGRLSIGGDGATGDRPLIGSYTQNFYGATGEAQGFDELEHRMRVARRGGAYK